MTEKQALRKIQRVKEMILKWNRDLEDFYKRSGDNELYVVGSSIIGDTDKVVPIVIHDETEKGFWWLDAGFDKEVKLYQDDEDPTYFDVEGYDDSMDAVKESIDYYRKMLRKSIRIWESENPDAEEEKDEED